MTPNIYTYSLLQYHHSLVLEEVLNVGVLVYYHQSQQLFFLHPDKLTRLRFAYPGLAEKTIKSYCKIFERRAEELTASPELFSRYNMEQSFAHFINDDLLPADSSSLQFSQPKKAFFSLDSTVEKTNNQLYNRFFGFFEEENDGTTRVDESVLIGQYARLFREITHENINEEQSKIFKDYAIHTTSDTRIVFDYAWQGQTLNLVKPVSFDLKRKISIERKAFYNYGRFTALQQEAEKNNYRFDLLLAKPRLKDLFKPYDEAIRLLEKTKHVNLVEDLKSYTEITVKALF